MQHIVNHIERFTSKPGAKLHLQWIPSHVGILANELADNCAKQACNLPTISEGTFIPSSELKPTWASTASSTNLEIHRLRQSTGGSWTASFQDTPCTSAWYLNKQLTRSEITRTNRLLLGHGNNRLFQYRMRGANCPHCRYCKDHNEVETIEHIITNCRQLRVAMMEALGGCTIREVMQGAGKPDNRLPHILECLEKEQVQF
ncbi:hypothetical protein GE061_000444 [Apolygus lucorum]|uniref:RNase H type-1 domain-containing protein n=1 Tax=Apolygus lucorum TaxID=248454 RepID=A0A8S9Y719_APOLU|nr:hypothetical protein GE061_000444 [Apolygus lucorum]